MTSEFFLIWTFLFYAFFWSVLVLFYLFRKPRNAYSSFCYDLISDSISERGKTEQKQTSQKDVKQKCHLERNKKWFVLKGIVFRYFSLSWMKIHSILFRSWYGHRCPQTSCRYAKGDVNFSKFIDRSSKSTFIKHSILVWHKNSCYSLFWQFSGSR